MLDVAGHENLFICDNRSVKNFEGKIRRVVGHVARLVGAPPPGFSTRKFLLEPGWYLPDDVSP